MWPPSAQRKLMTMTEGAAAVAAEAVAGGAAAAGAVAVATTTSAHLPAAQQICWAAGSVNGTPL